MTGCSAIGAGFLIYCESGNNKHAYYYGVEEVPPQWE